jgi:hypothetical protein
MYVKHLYSANSLAQELSNQTIISQNNRFADEESVTQVCAHILNHEYFQTEHFTHKTEYLLA